MASTLHHCHRNHEIPDLTIRVMLYKVNLSFLHFRSQDCPHGFYLFVCLGIFFPMLVEYLTHMETLLLPVKSCKFDLCSAVMVIEQ